MKRLIMISNMVFAALFSVCFLASLAGMVFWGAWWQVFVAIISGAAAGISIAEIRRARR
jgi:hypothetical protein